MRRVVITQHATQRMARRGISIEDVAQVWLHHDTDVSSKDHPGARDRTGFTDSGLRIRVCAREDAEAFVLFTVVVPGED